MLTKKVLDRKSFPLILVTLLQLCVSLVQCQRQCFLTGKVPLPSDVKPPTDVTCVPGRKIFAGIPDVTVDGKKFSDFDFTKFRGTPGGFALSQFSAADGKARDSLVTVGKLYTAVNAALRDRGERRILSRLKVVDFFIASQIDATKGNKQGVIRNLNKTIKNCGRSCNAAELAKLKAMVRDAER